MRKRNWAGIGIFLGYALYDLVLKPIWLLNVERLAERASIDNTLSDTASGSGIVAAVRDFFGFLPHSFGWGFATAALIFGFWDVIVDAFRRLILRRAAKTKPIDAMIHLLFEVSGTQGKCVKKEGTAAAFVLDGQVAGNIYKSDPKISRNTIAIIIVFAEDIAEPCPYVFADHDVIWREVKGDSRFMVIEVDLKTKEDVALGMIVRPQAWADGWRNTKPLKWNDATTLPRETVLASVEADGA
jgi:hypothetical protein